MGVERKVFDHSCDFKITISVKINSFSERIFIAEYFLCHILGQNDRPRNFEGCSRVTIDKLVAKDFEKVFISVEDSSFIKFLIIIGYQACSWPESCVRYDLGHFGCKSRGGRKGREGIMIISAPDFFSIRNSVDALGLFMIPVIAQLIMDP